MKKKLVKQVIAAVLFAAMLLGLAGCGSKPAQEAVKPQGGETTEKNETVEKGDPLGKYETPIDMTAARIAESIVKFDPSDPNKKSYDENIWIKTYAEKLGINLSYSFTAPDLEQYKSKWNTMAASGKLPDIAVVDASIYQMLLEGDMVEDMTDYFEAYASDRYKEACELDGGVAKAYCTQNGRLMGLPECGIQPDGAPMLWIRRDWLNAVGMEVPKTIEDVEKAAIAFMDAKLGGNGTYGICASKDILSGNCDLVGFLNGYGAYYNTWVDDGTGKLVYGTVQDSMKDALLKLQEMYKAGMINKDFAVNDSSIAEEDVAAGKVGMVYGSFWSPNVKIIDNIKNDEKADWIPVEIPTVDGSEGKPQATIAPVGYIFVKKGIKYPEAAVKLVNLQLDLVYEDFDHYSTSPDGYQYHKLALTKCFMPWQNMTRYKEACAALETGNMNFTNNMSKITYEALKEVKEGNREKLNQMIIFGPEGAFSIVKKYNDGNRIMLNKFQSLSTETMKLKDETLRTSLDAAIMKVIMGEDISVFEKAASDWYKMGGQIITDEVNTWYATTK